MIIETSSYFSLEAYQPELEPRLSPESIQAFIQENLGAGVIIWVKEGFMHFIHDEIDTREAPPYHGIMNQPVDQNMILYPWYRNKDFSNLGRALLAKGGFHHFLEEMGGENHQAHMTLQSPYGLMIPFNQIVMMGRKSRI